MHRFRKKSDAKRPTTLQPVPAPVHQTQTERHERYESGPPPDSLPELPLASDFRTSLILTDLSRRFTLLGATSSESASVDALRSRLADQRARGAENQISEEEEDMIIETLGFRQTARSDADDEYTSSTSARSAVSSSNTSTSSKRYSNNLFGSGRFRDYSYMRSVSQAKTASMRTSDSSRVHTALYTDTMRPVTPDANPSASPSSSPETLAVRSAPLIPPAPYGGQPLSVAEYRLSKTLGPSVLRRASLALEEAIKAIEEEAEDEIVMPRSPPVPRGSMDTQRQSLETRESDFIRTSGAYEAPMAISSDKHLSLDPESPRASPIPSRIVPGYVPGMPRPMTPRDTMELDDQRSYSTTPRATSPTLPSLVSPSPIPPSNFSLGLARRESTSSPSRHSPRPSSPNVSSPMFLQRTPNGRYTPEDAQRAESAFSGDFEGSLNSSILGRRARPASPLSGTAYQPMAVSARPGTPSNVTWTAAPNGNSKPMGHNRDPSWISDSSGNSEQSQTRSLRSPALPDSPLIGPGHSTMNSFSSSFSSTSSFESPRPMSSISGVDIGSPVMGTNRVLRSPTPTQVAGRSPTSGSLSNFELSSKNGSRRSSKQNTPSTPFTLGPFQSLVFSPIANSSRSSLESAGSSYHSWDGEHKDRTAALFSDADPQRPLWHEISSNGQPNYETPNSSPDDWEAEDIIMKYAGLKKDDFLAIQDKLVGAAVAKTMAPDVHHRAPSLRRRRPSTSQSNYSLNSRLGSPPQSPTTSGPTADQYSALLNSVVDSIQSSPTSHPPPVDTTNIIQSDDDISPTTRRNRDLAQVLFGEQEKEDKEPLNLTLSFSGNPENSHVPNSAPLDSSFPLHSPQAVPPSSASATWPYEPSRNPSTPRLPPSAQEHAELAKEVQRKTDAAMVMLQKQPSTSNLALPPKAPVTRKRISPNQISTPQLVSASTSVDTIPLPSPSMTSGQSNKIGSRLKRLRGSLRTKTTLPTAEDITPFPMDLRSPPPVQTARYEPAKFRAPGGPVAASATESEGFKVPLPSPPASAGPGLKGFMARFRGKQQRASETQGDLDYQRPQARTQHLPPPSPEHALPQSPSWLSPQSPNNHSPPDSLPISPPAQPRTPPPPSTPASTSASTSMPSQYILPMPATRSTTAPLYSSRPHQSVQSSQSTETADASDAIKQLFDAASNLGLDQGALNDLLARSGSTSSRSTDWTMLTRNNSSAASRPNLPQENVQGAETSRSNSQRTQLTVPPNPSEGMTQTAQADHVRRPRDGAPDKSAVVRRTIIYPSESRSSTIDLSVLIRKHSTKSRRRASATSVSSRSVHDRAPTPPPPRANTGRRFSTDITSPPVPHLPQSLPQQTDRLLVPPPDIASPGEKSSSAYDSFRYDMYSGEKVAGSSAAETTQSGSISEAGPAVEVIELANGETIWSIVNGLRDEDDDLDSYANRASFASEYSVREGTGDGVQVFFKEHGRKGSGGSSFLPRRKTLTAKSRPETKVFYSSSAQIGRLIENISQGMEAGSFNILPTHPLGHSTSSSLSETEMNWTVEERLEHMLHGLR
ncbi:hypothetical protein MVEN_02067700 [Mycena venus]|uniref:Uncharacterized protein n=1 Tax=Mycena venus TaxID=2733690 RepID=A0A8H6XDE1_9AGAR|nr:hypothetical protein MVEN_02067700 [Mycena venus]